MMRKPNSLLKSDRRKWLKLQKSHSIHRNDRTILYIRIGFFFAVGVFMIMAVYLSRNMNQGYQAKVVVNYHRGFARKGEASISGGISLDQVGDLSLQNPVHQLCEGRLFFVEHAQDFTGLSSHLQTGKVLSEFASSSIVECCGSCSEGCHGFRFQSETCELLRFSNLKAPADINFQESMNARYFVEGKAKAQAERRMNKLKLRQQPPNPPAVIEKSIAKKEPVEERVVDELVVEEEEDREELQFDDNLEDEPKTQLEPVKEHKIAENKEMPLKVERKEEKPLVVDSNDIPGSFLGGLGSVFEDGDLFKKDVVATESDDQLMNELMKQVEDRHNPQREEEEKKKKARVVKDMTEDPLDESVNEEIAETRLKQIVPLGDYRRHTSRDTFYPKYINLFLRYRSNREMMSVSEEMSRVYKDVSYVTVGQSGDKKKPQMIKSLRVGNGRRGKHVFIVGTLRGCEWTSSLSILHTAMALKGRGASTKQLLDAVQFHFISVANPDGFDYSHHKTPANAISWCKNRRVAVSGSHGVDLEHNWGLDNVTWGFGRRDGAKLDDYQGPSNFSEPEVRSLRDYMLHYSTGRGRVALMHVRCCNGVIKPPQVYVEKENPINVNTVANLLSRYVEQTDGSKYSVEQRETSFHAKNHGQMIDWAHNEANIDHAYVVELKGAGLATRTDHAKISVDPFQTLLRELETATVFLAQRLLQMPMEGPEVDTPYTPNLHQVAHDTPETTSAGKTKKKRKL
mmetsp:Transcript_43958/g.70346  ORF Transcript_43958/g.70346 Transcript_43958/m.70346 type:complete len:740 (+) Transcript_43958:316-2535(+)